MRKEYGIGIRELWFYVKKENGDEEVNMRRIYSRRFKGILCLVLTLTLLIGATSGVAQADISSAMTQSGELSPEENTMTEEPGTGEDSSATQEDSSVTQEDSSATQEESDGMEEPTATEEPSESEASVPGDEVASVTYDPQPTTIEEVQAAIDEYNEEFQAVLAESGFLAALEVAKPHWEFEVDASIMPPGYNCQLVEQDEDFDANYYTFFQSLMTMAFGGGTGTVADPYKIVTEQDLKDLATAVNATIGGNTFSGSVFELQNDIAMTSSFPGIGTTNRPFSGTFDGKGHKISNLTGTSNSNAYGFFGYTDENAVVRNLNVELGGRLGSTYTAGSRHGVIIGVARKTAVQNCNVDGKDNTIAGNLSVGGIVGYAQEYVSIENCTTKNITLQGESECGGIVGRAAALATDGHITIKDCTVDNITSIVNVGYASGFIGIGEGGNATNGTNIIENCFATNVKTTSGVNYSAGFAGALRQFNVTNCEVTNSESNGHSYVGGFAGVIYNGSEVIGCYSKDNTIKARAYAGGFSGAIYNDGGVFPSYVKNCYSAGGTVIQTDSTYYSFGGFAGTIYDQAVVENCYAQTDVTSRRTNSISGGTGGFTGTLGLIGTTYVTTIKNCYSTGSVTSTQDNNLIGSFVGLKVTAVSKITNSYATGTVTVPGDTSKSGGFAGNVAGANSITGCFYDTTTTRRTSAVGSGDTSQSITGLSTKKMIEIGSYSAWGAKENFLGVANGSGNDSSPWYIDDEITYPYFYYQYDGHSKDDTNYYIANTTYADGSGLGQKRADFTVKKDSLPLKVKSFGAVKAYLPYSGTSRYDISKSSYTSVPGAKFDTQLHSLGGISATNIIAYDGAPYIEKSNNTAAWDYSDTNTYTYVGDTVEYTIFMANYSDVNDWRNVVVTDYLGKGVTLVKDSLTIIDQDGASVTLTYWDKEGGEAEPSGKPYYTYIYDAGITTSDGRSSGVYVLTIYFPDMNAIADTGYISEYTITFDGFINKESASEFDAVNPEVYNGHIKNDVKGVGDFINHFDNSVIENGLTVTSSDEDKDPVYNKYIVSYNNNLTDDYKTDSSDTELIKGYYLTDGTEQHQVLDNTVDNGFGFTRDGYEFIGWATADSSGNVIDSFAAGDTFYVSEDTVLYARWKKIITFDFTKVSALDDNVVLEGAGFKLYEYKGNGTPSGLVDESSSDWTPADSGQTSDAAGEVSFLLKNAKDGSYYQLIETSAPTNFKLPTGQWLIKVNIASTGDVTYDITKVNGTDGEVPPAFKHNSSDKYLLQNIPVVGLPAMGGNGTALYMLIGTSIVFVGLVFGIWASAHRRKNLSI